MNRHGDLGPGNAFAERRPSAQWEGNVPPPSMMAQRLQAAAATSAPTTVAASAPKTRPFQVQPPAEHLYSTSDSWNHSSSRANIQVAPSRPPKIYDAPPPSITYRRPSATPERTDPTDAKLAPLLIPSKTATAFDSRGQRTVEPRQPSPSSLFTSPSYTTSYDRKPERASTIHPPSPSQDPISSSKDESSPIDDQPQTLPPRPGRRPFDIEAAAEPERRGSTGPRPFEVRPSPNPLSSIPERRDAPKLDIPFRSPMFFPSLSSDKAAKGSSPLAPEASARKGSTPTFEFEPPTGPSTQGSSQKEAPGAEIRWFDDVASPTSPKAVRPAPSAAAAPPPAVRIQATLPTEPAVQAAVPTAPAPPVAVRAPPSAPPAAVPTPPIAPIAPIAPAPAATAPAAASPPSPPTSASPQKSPSPKSKPSPPPRLNLAAIEKLDDIQPPPGPPPPKGKGKEKNHANNKKSVSFATRDSIISAVAYPQSPFSDDSYMSLGSPLPVSFDMIRTSSSPRDSTDSAQGELPIFLRIDTKELQREEDEDDDDTDEKETKSKLESVPPPAGAPPSSTQQAVSSSSAAAVPPLFIPPPAGPPPGLVVQPQSQSQPSPQMQTQKQPESPRKDEDTTFDAAVAQLVDYGFSPEEAQRGLLENGSGIDVQAAANWLLDEANAPEPPPLPQRPGQSSHYSGDPPSPLSPSDDASSDLYEAEPVSPVSLYHAPLPKDTARPNRSSSACSGKEDTTPYETYRPSSSSQPSQVPPSPPSSSNPTPQDMPADPPAYEPPEQRARLPNPLSSHPVQVEPYAPPQTTTQHKIPRKKVPLPSLNTRVPGGASSSASGSGSTSTTGPPISGKAAPGTSALAAAVMANLGTAMAPVAPETEFAPVSKHRTSDSTASSLTSATASPRSSSEMTSRAPRKRGSSLSKGWGSRFAGIGQKANKGIATLAIRVNHAGFVGETIEKECDKAARILRVFCKHGVYANPGSEAATPFSPQAPSSSATGSTQSSGAGTTTKKLVRIPPEIMQKAVGLAIFTTLRVGLGLGESTGSGIVIARLHDGSWSPPSAIQLQSFGAGVAAGVDIFDCVCVINTQEALTAFTSTRFSLGAGVAVAAGPWGTGRSVEWGSMHNRDRDARRAGRKASITEDTGSGVSAPPAFELNGAPLAVQDPKNRNQGNTVTMSPVYSYVKSKGLFAGLTYEGNVVNERKEANRKFYGEDVTGEQILRGGVRAPEGKESLKVLHEVLLAAEDYGPGGRQSVMDPMGGPPPTIQEEGVMDAGPSEPQTNWPMDIKPKFPENSLHPAEAFGIRQ